MPKKIWTEEMVAIAAGMRRVGFTHAKIAERLGVTESAVRGKMQKVKARRRLDGNKPGNSGVFCRGPLALGILDIHKDEEDEA